MSYFISPPIQPDKLMFNYPYRPKLNNKKKKSQSTNSCTEGHSTALPMNTVTPCQLEERPEPLPAFILPLTDLIRCTWILIGTSSKLAPGKSGRWSLVSQRKVGSGSHQWSLCQAQWGKAG